MAVPFEIYTRVLRAGISIDDIFDVVMSLRRKLVEDMEEKEIYDLIKTCSSQDSCHRCMERPYEITCIGCSHQVCKLCWRNDGRHLWCVSCGDKPLSFGKRIDEGDRIRCCEYCEMSDRHCRRFDFS